ncbi:MAG: TIGR02996 domain-containing protein [Myxococcales bacterium]|nr:TIGR02996 domain-containing protein [Myxococcales bacterium]
MSDADWLARVRAHPDDDEVRLAYADACDADDPARAELVRVQCRLARLRGHPPERKVLRDREAALLAAHRERWVGPLHARVRWPWFRRGFLEQVTLHPEESPSVLEDLLAAHPVRALAFADGDDVELTRPLATSMARWAEAPVLARLEALDGTEQMLGHDAWRVLLRSPHLRELPELVIGDHDATPDTAAAIAAEPGPRLRRLTVSGYLAASLGDDGVAHLAAAPHLGSLEHLALWNCRCAAGAGAALAGGPWTSTLVTLHLGLGQYALNQLGPDGARALAAGVFPRLETLDLDFNALGDDGGEAIVESRGFPALTYLTLHANELTNVTLRAFMRAHDRMPRLSALDLSLNRIDGGGLSSLASYRLLAQLRGLWLRGNPIWPGGVAALAASPRAAGLRDLDLSDTALGKDPAAAAAALAGSPHLQDLERLRVARSGLTDAERARLRDRFGDRVRW